MIKIGIECEQIESGYQWGVGRIITKLLEEISRRPELSREFRFYLYFKSKIPDLLFLDNPIFIKKIIKQPFGLNSFSFYYYVFLPIKLWFEKLDLMFYPNYMLPLIHKGKSLVTVTPDAIHLIKDGNFTFRHRLAYKIFIGHAIKHATALTSVSETAVKELKNMKAVKVKNIFATPLGADTKKFSMRVDTKYKIQNTKYLLFVAQAFPRRYLKETMLAVDQLQSEFPDLRLIAIGKDKYNQPIIKKLVEEINQKYGREVIIYKEYVPEDELIALYQNAKSFIYVSRQEAFGLPPLEALAAGSVPVVADTELNQEIYGNNAFKVKHNTNPQMTCACLPVGRNAANKNQLNYSAEDITGTIKESLTKKEKRQQIINAAPEILAKYTWEKHTNAFLSAVGKLI